MKRKKKRKINDGTTAILLPIRFITCWSIMLIILNNILPVNTGKIGFKSFPWVLLLCCFYISSILNAHGETQEYSIPLGKILVTRTLQFLISKIPYFSEINLIVFFILCVGDAILLITLCLHKKYFEFEVI